jgi:hypothetical protein
MPTPASDRDLLARDRAGGLALHVAWIVPS